MMIRASNNVTWLLTIGLAFHLIFIGSVFDCYFKSPVVHGMRSFRLENAESKRLVLIIGDGLRADLLFNKDAVHSIPGAPLVIAPYLRSIAEFRGAFGVSHTRVPTESRPGHVAIIGGMYEDVSAVTKGWKSNPVDFDSVFNQSSHTFSFGSPDILPMFAHGATPGKVKTWCYNEEDEDFTKDATSLDIWVLDQLRSLLRNATIDKALDSQLRGDKVVFFLHLLGLDTTGHSYRPHSKEYMNNINVVDDIVRDTEELFNEFYNDEDTSYIFTADHGMSKIGNHGDGDPDNTRTPLIAWGRGIRGPLPDIIPSSHDEYSQSWELGHLFRRDLEQADIASLMASLVGIDWPMNSVGVLPDVDPTQPGYLLPAKGDETKARAALVNAQVILEQYRVKHELKRAHTLFYKPFTQLEGAAGSKIPLRLSELVAIEQLIRQMRWDDARQKSLELINSSLEGLRYLQTYDRFVIRSIVIAAYTGWAAYAALFVFLPETLSAAQTFHRSFLTNMIATSVLFTFWAIFWIQRSPWTFYVYITFPCYFWNRVALHTARPLYSRVRARNNNFSFYVRQFVLVGLVISTLLCMMAAYTHRWIWSFGFVLMGAAWPLLSWPSHVRTQNPRVALAWAVICTITGKFPLLGVDKRESLQMILLGGLGMIFVGFLSAIVITQNPVADKRLQTAFSIQLLLIGLAMVITISSVSSLQAKAGLPIANQISAWVVLVTSSIYPFISPVKHLNPFSKSLSFFLGLAPCFVFLSISVEGLFYLAFSATLALWTEIEAVLRASSSTTDDSTQIRSYTFQVDDLRIALFFLFFVQVAFFGTGNVASISSFYLEPVYRLVPVFSPFIMAALLIFKIVAPYVILSATFATMNARLKLPPFSLFLVALTLTDVMTLAFFFNVTDAGSWLDIGQSITFFCIASLLLVWSAGICVAGEYLMADTLLPQLSTKPKKIS